MTLKLTYNGQFNIENEDFYYFGTCTFIWCFRIVANEGTDSCPDFLSMTTFGPTLVKMVLTLTIITDCRHHFMMQHFLSEWVPAVKTPNLRAIFSGATRIHIVWKLLKIRLIGNYETFKYILYTLCIVFENYFFF